MVPNLKIIGVIHSCYPDRFGVPRQPGLVEEARAFIELERIWQPELSLMGLERFSHIWVLFWFHRNQESTFHAKVHPPRLGGEPVGVFATRSPHRPNPIGLSVVKIEKVTEAGVWVLGGDFVDQTPVLDIKPYVPQIEAFPHAKMDWSSENEKLPAQIEWSEEASQVLQEWEAQLPHLRIRSLIEGTLALDPRPNVYKRTRTGSSAAKQVHACRIYDGDVHFSFAETNGAPLIQVIKIIRKKQSKFCYSSVE